MMRGALVREDPLTLMADRRHSATYLHDELTSSFEFLNRLAS